MKRWPHTFNFQEFHLPYNPPFDWSNVSYYLRGHLLPGIETLDDTSFSRVFKIDGAVGAFRISPDKSRRTIRLQISLNHSRHFEHIKQRVREMLDLDYDPVVVEKALTKNRHMASLLKRHTTLRLIRGFEPFETSIAIILGQLVSTERARQMFRELVVNHGTLVTNELTGEDAYLFPTPEELACASLDKVKTTGMRKTAIREFARHVHEGHLDFHAGHDVATMREKMIAIKGIGPWTVEFVCMRALGDRDAFPAKDLILDRVLKLRPNLRIENTSPWRSYSALYLWREYAAKLSGAVGAKPFRRQPQKPTGKSMKLKLKRLKVKRP